MVEQRDVPLYKTGLGSVQAFNSVSISSRVDGQLIRLGFVEGQMVKAGAVIAEIDPRSYEASLRQSEAQLRNNRAKLSAVKGDFDRLEDLHRRGVATPQSYEGKRSEVEQIEASIEAMAALLCAANAVASKAPVTFTTLLARASRSPSSFCSTAV